MQNITLPEKIVIISVILIITLIGAGTYFVLTHTDKTEASAKLELSPQAVMDAVTKIAELPAEQPTIATVTDKQKLSQFQFFSQAQLGDRVLIFNEAKKAYLYRPSTNKIVEVGPIIISEEQDIQPQQASGEQPSESSVAAVQTEPATITLLNGTKGKGVAAKAEKDLLREESLNIEIKTKGNSKKDYQKTQLYYVNADKKEISEQIAQVLNAEIIELPQGESTPKTDIVVFLGDDRL